MDTISRAAAIDALRMDIDIIPYAKAREYARAVIETVYNRLEELPSVQQWIPCSERLPKEDGRYLITEKYLFGDHLYVGIANYGVPMMPMNKGRGRGWFITDSEGDYYCDMNYVLAWMPLPESYKGEQS